MLKVEEFEEVAFERLRKSFFPGFFFSEREATLLQDLGQFGHISSVFGRVNAASELTIELFPNGWELDCGRGLGRECLEGIEAVDCGPVQSVGVFEVVGECVEEGVKFLHGVFAGDDHLPYELVHPLLLLQSPVPADLVLPEHLIDSLLEGVGRLACLASILLSLLHPLKHPLDFCGFAALQGLGECGHSAVSMLHDISDGLFRMVYT